MLFLIRARRKQGPFYHNIIFADNKVILLPNTLKYTNPNRSLKPLTYLKYEAEKKIVHCKLLTILSRKTTPPSE